MSKAVQPVERLYPHLDRIAEARRAGRVREMRQEIDAVERSVSVRPINPTGAIDQHMVSQVMDQVASKRETLRAVEALSGDDLVLMFCQDVIQPQSDAPELRQQDGSPIARGARMAPIAPGMF